MAKHLWFDLENTIITPVTEGWFNTHIINSEKIKKIISEFKPDFYHLFSFAVWNEHELIRFNQGTQPMIENHFKFKFCTTWTVDDEIIPKCCEVLKLVPSTVEFSDAVSFWGKHESFRLCMRQTYKNTFRHDVDTEVMFLDDDVINEKFEWSDLRIKGSIVNIDLYQ